MKNDKELKDLLEVIRTQTTMGKIEFIPIFFDGITTRLFNSDTLPERTFSKQRISEIFSKNKITKKLYDQLSAQLSEEAFCGFINNNFITADQLAKLSACLKEMYGAKYGNKPWIDYVPKACFHLFEVLLKESKYR